MSDEVRLAKSGGPATPEGKARSSRNAIKHGLRAQAIVLPSENEAEWTAHRDGIVAALAPANALEASIVDRIAELTWRQARVVRAESAYVAHRQYIYEADDVAPTEALERYETHLARQLALAIATLERARLLAI